MTLGFEQLLLKAKGSLSVDQTREPGGWADPNLIVI